MNIHTKAKQIVSTFSKTFGLSEEIPEPSSWWSEEMQMLEDDPELNIEMRLYIEWEPFKERTTNGWTFYAPHHVFKLPKEDHYLLGQKNEKWILYYPKTHTWEIPGFPKETKRTFVEILENSMY